MGTDDTTDRTTYGNIEERLERLFSGDEDLRDRLQDTLDLPEFAFDADDAADDETDDADE